MLSSRDVISIIKQRIQETTDRRVVLDFSNISFISRSAAHELLQLKDQHNKFWNFKKVSYQNISPEVNQMFAIVEKQKNSKRKLNTEIPEVNFEELKNI